MRIAFAVALRPRTGSADTAHAASISRVVVSGVGGRPAKRVFRERVAVRPHVLGEGQHAGIPVLLPAGAGARTGVGMAPESRGRRDVQSSFTASLVERLRGRDAQAGHGHEEHERQGRAS